MLNQQVIRNLFGLPSDENIYDDFACNHNKKPGKLYISENHICFYSDFLGVSKLVLKFVNIDEIIKGKSTIEAKVGTEAHKFSGFNDIESAYKYIETSWASCCPNKSVKEVVPEDSPADAIESPRPSIVKPETSETSAKEAPKYHGPLFEMDDSQIVQRSLLKYPKRENEHLRLVFGLTVEQYYRRFVDTGAVYSDVKNLEVMGAKEIDDKGWVDDKDAACKKRTVTLQYKMDSKIFTAPAYSIKENTLYYTP
eukprot:TRINITY_DN5348_c0_g1_i2.p1 TRINITY_DN5348_c0_g1~~TRINITY_DN5348_c0_g1_i2.p1  ORF type:complete len:253 (-),score=49.22 TRINITY_DN5348_c0_g1_i2:730-1488(-)